MSLPDASLPGTSAARKHVGTSSRPVLAGLGTLLVLPALLLPDADGTMTATLLALAAVLYLASVMVYIKKYWKPQ